MNPLLASILANPEQHRVNRSAKLNVSVDKRVEEIEKRRAYLAEAKNGGERDDELKYGYGLGHGRSVGD